jgi:hypothetical protein
MKGNGEPSKFWKFGFLRWKSHVAYKVIAWHHGKIMGIPRIAPWTSLT